MLTLPFSAAHLTMSSVTHPFDFLSMFAPVVSVWCSLLLLLLNCSPPRSRFEIFSANAYPMLRLWKLRTKRLRFKRHTLKLVF